MPHTSFFRDFDSTLLTTAADRALTALYARMIDAAMTAEGVTAADIRTTGSVMMIVPKHWSFHPAVTQAMKHAGAQIIGVPSEEVHLARDKHQGDYYQLARDLLQDDRATVFALCVIADDLPPAHTFALFRHVLRLEMSDGLLREATQKLTGQAWPKGRPRPDLTVLEPSHLLAALLCKGDATRFADHLHGVAAKDASDGSAEPSEPASDTARAIDKITKARGGYTPEILHPKETLEHLYGMEDAMGWARDVMADLKAYRDGQLAWEDMDRGVLLQGPPGTGKSRFAVCLAGSAGLPLVKGGVGGWQSHREGHLGDTLMAMKDTFEIARLLAPCFLLIDEVDGFIPRATGQEDKSDRNYRDDYWRQVVNELLSQLDGPKPREGVVVIATTNHGAMIDGALLRPGRLDRVITIKRPDVRARAGILAARLGEPWTAGDLLEIASRMGEKSGAEIEQVVRDAKRPARSQRRAVTLQDIERAAKVRHAPWLTARRYRIAVHEVGHALMAEHLWPGSVEFVSIEPRPKEGINGETRFRDEMDTSTPDEIDCVVQMLLAGVAAERLMLGGHSLGHAGAKDGDLAKATLALGSKLIGYEIGGWHDIRLTLLGAADVRLFTMLFESELRPRIEAELIEVEARVQTWLAQRRGRIEALADQLVQDGTLPGSAFKTSVIERLRLKIEAMQAAAVARGELEDSGLMGACG